MTPLLRGTLVAGALTLAHGVALACSCAPPDPDPAGYDAVFLGVARGGLSAGCGGDALGGGTTFEVTEAFRGVEVGEKVRVEHRTDSAACGVVFEKGESYLVYASDHDGDGVQNTNLCNPGGPEAAAGALLEDLRAR